MEIRIQLIHSDAAEQLQAFIRKEVSKLEKYYEGIKKVEVSLRVVKPEIAENREAGTAVSVLNNDFHAGKIYDMSKEAVDLCVGALERQLVKYKEKQRNG